MVLFFWLLMSYADVTLANGLRLHYEDEGKGEPLVLIGGLGSRLQAWDEVAPMLAKRFRVIRPDNRGIGGSGDLEGPYSVETMAQDVAGLMEALGLARYHVAGISLGSFAAQSLALQYPERVMRLVLIGSSPGGQAHVPPGPETLAFFQTMMTLPVEERARKGLALALHPDFVEAHPQSFEALVAASVNSQTPQAVIFRQAMAGMAFDHSLKAGEIAVPTLILHGDGDRVVPPANGENLHRLIPKSTWMLLEKAGHLCIVDQAAVVANAITGFLSAP